MIDFGLANRAARPTFQSSVERQCLNDSGALRKLFKDYDPAFASAFWRGHLQGDLTCLELRQLCVAVGFTEEFVAAFCVSVAPEFLQPSIRKVLTAQNPSEALTAYLWKWDGVAHKAYSGVMGQHYETIFYCFGLMQKPLINVLGILLQQTHCILRHQWQLIAYVGELQGIHLFKNAEELQAFTELPGGYPHPGELVPVKQPPNVAEYVNAMFGTDYSWSDSDEDEERIQQFSAMIDMVQSEPDRFLSQICILLSVATHAKKHKQILVKFKPNMIFDLFFKALHLAFSHT